VNKTEKKLNYFKPLKDIQLCFVCSFRENRDSLEILEPLEKEESENQDPK